MPDKKEEGEPVLLCVSASSTGVDVIRRASALSHAIGAELIASRCCWKSNRITALQTYHRIMNVSWLSG